MSSDVTLNTLRKASLIPTPVPDYLQDQSSEQGNEAVGSVHQFNDYSMINRLLLYSIFDTTFEECSGRRVSSLREQCPVIVYRISILSFPVL